MKYPVLDKSSFVPIYYQLYKHFEAMIRSGELAPGDMLPTEMEFAEAFGISRMTVRRAIGELSAAGMVHSVKGKGTFVAQPKLDEITFNLNQRFIDGESDEEVSQTLLECRIIRADAHIGGRLGIDVGTRCLFCRMVSKAGGIPLVYETRYAVYTKRAPLIENQLKDMSLTHIVSAHSDKVPSRTKRVLMASRAMADEPKVLQIEAGDPVFLMIQTIYDDDNQTIAWGKSIHRGDRYRLVSYNGWNLEEVKKTGGKSFMYEPLVISMASLEPDAVNDLVRQYLAGGVSALDIIENCRKGVDIVGKRYQNGEYFLSDLVMCEAIFKEVMEIAEPHLPKLPPAPQSDHPQIVLGTIEGDIHDLGKNIVAYLLRAAGYDVLDLGVEVPVERFVKEVKERDVRILGVCFLLTSCMNTAKRLIETLREEGLREKVTVVIGGYAADEATRVYVGADLSASSAVHVVDLFDGILHRVR